MEELLDRCRDVPSLFAKHHIGEVGRILQKLEQERNKLKRDLSLLVGQNYIKILEAAGAVGEMHVAANEIEDILSRLDNLEVVLRDSASNEDFPTAAPANAPTMLSACLRLSAIWNLVQDSKLCEALEIISELSLLQDLPCSISKSLREARETILFQSSLALQDHRVSAEQLKAAFLINAEQSQASAVILQAFKDHLSHLRICKRIPQVGDYLSLLRNFECLLQLPQVADIRKLADELIDRFIEITNGEGELLLRLAGGLYTPGVDCPLAFAALLFSRWAKALPSGSPSAVSETILCLSQAFPDLPAPKEWVALVRQQLSLPTNLPFDKRLFYSLLYPECFQDGAKVIHRSQDSSDGIAEAGRTFVPTGLPQIVKFC